MSRFGLSVDDRHHSHTVMAAGPRRVRVCIMPMAITVRATDDDDADGLVGGLEFPSESHPDYWDFMYFSYVVGMTSQVSDVQISGRELRRLALIHGVVSFFFNTIILALTINIRGEFSF